MWFLPEGCFDMTGKYWGFYARTSDSSQVFSPPSSFASKRQLRSPNKEWRHRQQLPVLIFIIFTWLNRASGSKKKKIRYSFDETMVDEKKNSPALCVLKIVNRNSNILDLVDISGKWKKNAHFLNEYMNVMWRNRACVWFWMFS